MRWKSRLTWFLLGTIFATTLLVGMAKAVQGSWAIGECEPQRVTDIEVQHMSGQRYLVWIDAKYQAELAEMPGIDQAFSLVGNGWNVDFDPRYDAGSVICAIKRLAD